jgi:hypothetical protein
MALVGLSPLNAPGPEGQTWYVNPLNVTALRPRWTGSEMHMEECDESEEMCVLRGAERVGAGDRVCEQLYEDQHTEVLFVNTIGPQSSVVVVEPVSKVRELMDDALRRMSR